MYLPANGVRALRALGLEDAVAARGTRIPRQRLLDHRGHLLADIDLQQLWGSVGPCLALPGPSCTRSSARACRCSCAAPSGRWRTSTGPSRSASTTAAVATTTWSSGPTGCAPRSGGWLSTHGRRSRSASTAGGSWPPAARGHHLDGHARRGTSFLTVPVGQGLVYAYADVTADTTRSGEWDGDPAGQLRGGSPASPPRSHSCCGNSTTRTGCMSPRSSRSPPQAGAAARCCWSATPPTACPQHGPGRRPGLRGRPGAGRLPARRRHGHRRGGRLRRPAQPRTAGSAPRPTAATGPATFHPPSATSPYGPSVDGSSGPTTDPCWIRFRRLSNRARGPGTGRSCCMPCSAAYLPPHHRRQTADTFGPRATVAGHPAPATPLRRPPMRQRPHGPAQVRSRLSRRRPVAR